MLDLRKALKPPSRAKMDPRSRCSAELLTCASIASGSNVSLSYCLLTPKRPNSEWCCKIWVSSLVVAKIILSFRADPVRW